MSFNFITRSRNMTTEPVQSPFLKIAVHDSERLKAIAILKQHQLPVEDIDADKPLYLLLDGQRVIGTAGLEMFEDCALLRSVSVIKAEQGKGFGRIITAELEKQVKESGINCLYLITTSAKGFFERQGYGIIKRAESPAAIKQTAEFTALCPASAVVMKKRI